MVPTNLIAQKPPGGYEEGSLIYNTNNNSAYIRTTDGGLPTWTLLNGSGGGGGGGIWEQVVDPQIGGRNIARLDASAITTGTENTTTMVYGSQTADSGGVGYNNTRMMFRQQTDTPQTSDGAFRAGAVSGTQWDDVNIGTSSAAFGQDNTASGIASFSYAYEF